MVDNTTKELIGKIRRKLNANKKSELDPQTKALILQLKERIKQGKLQQSMDSLSGQLTKLVYTMGKFNLPSELTITNPVKEVGVSNLKQLEGEMANIARILIRIEKKLGIEPENITNEETIRVDEFSKDKTYIGKAQVGSDENDPVWQIQFIEKSEKSGETKIKWCEGNENYDNIWARRDWLKYE